MHNFLINFKMYISTLTSDRVNIVFLTKSDTKCDISIVYSSMYRFFNSFHLPIILLVSIILLLHTIHSVNETKLCLLQVYSSHHNTWKVITNDCPSIYCKSKIPPLATKKYTWGRIYRRRCCKQGGSVTGLARFLFCSAKLLHDRNWRILLWNIDLTFSKVGRYTYLDTPNWYINIDLSIRMYNVLLVTNGFGIIIKWNKSFNKLINWWLSY